MTTVLNGHPSIDRLAERLEGLRGGDGAWQAKCPCHDDSRASLSLGVGRDGRLLFHCHAGCDSAAILGKLGLTWPDVMPANDNSKSRSKSSGTIIKTYDYKDENGDLVFQVCRLEPKSFRQRRPDGKGGWIWNMEGVTRTLYQYPKLIDTELHETIFICEGEKSCDYLNARGVTAICSSGGAGKWEPRFAEQLRNRPVVILADNDLPGRKHAEQVARSAEGKAASVKVVALPNLPDKGDVVDWMQTGGSVAQLLELSDATAEWKSTAAEVEAVEETGFRIQCYSLADFLKLDFHCEPLIDRILVAKEPCILGGRSKVLKTSIFCDLALSGATGSPFLGVFNVRRPFLCGFISGESGGFVIQETFKRIAAARGIQIPDELGLRVSTMLPKLCQADHREAFERWIREHRLEVVGIDPLYLSILDGNSAGDASNLYAMGERLRPLTEIAKATGCTIVCLHHFRKSGNSDRSVPPELDELSQAGVSEWAAQWILLSRRERYDCDGRHQLWMASGGRAGHGGLWHLDIDEGQPDADLRGRSWAVVVASATESRKQADDTREAEKKAKAAADKQFAMDVVWQKLNMFPDGQSESKIVRGNDGVSRDKSEAMLYELVRLGRAVKCKVPTQGRGGSVKLIDGYKPAGQTDGGLLA